MIYMKTIPPFVGYGAVTIEQNYKHSQLSRFNVYLNQFLSWIVFLSSLLYCLCFVSYNTATMSPTQEHENGQVCKPLGFPTAVFDKLSAFFVSMNSV